MLLLFCRFSLRFAIVVSTGCKMNIKLFTGSKEVKMSCGDYLEKWIQCQMFTPLPLQEHLISSNKRTNYLITIGETLTSTGLWVQALADFLSRVEEGGSCHL